MLGGAGNVLRNLAAVGVSGILVGVVGDDAAGQAVRALVAETGAGDEHVITATMRATTIKERYRAGAQQLLRADREAEGPIPDEIQSALIKAAQAAIEGAGHLCSPTTAKAF